MLKLDHITVIAPTLNEGVSHVRECLDLDVPFGTRHEYMGTHNHRLQLGGRIYLEIVALDPEGVLPGRARWFGLDDQQSVRSDWEEGRRLRGWVANSDSFNSIPSEHRAHFGGEVPLPFDKPSFAFCIPEDGSLPLDGAVPSLIDHKGDPTSMAEIPDLGTRLRSLTLEHPDPVAIERMYRDLMVDQPPEIVRGPKVRYRAVIETPTGLKELT
ncbi:VOC family protein [Roseibium sp. SCP14]|uniref:VOC family protein n=1 Tax=Roseibium sp. SCP14 TaxID=3141375 RepID=UPI0033362668